MADDTNARTTPEHRAALQKQPRRFEGLISDDVDDVIGMAGNQGEAYETRQLIYNRLRASLWRTEMTGAMGTRVKVALPKKGGNPEAREHIKLKMFCAGGLAGGVAKTVGSPLSRATIEMQTQASLGKKSTNLIQVLR